ncbi:leucine-rich repeat domain-containing protein, partial [Catellatospora sp. NPDC049133]|uniref:leucine-rich repeat domain-containing protein n=1 Tax=Catellatospora sp. NPDC049133 TaxID=3155499 RepID=UPI0033E85750
GTELDLSDLRLTRLPDSFTTLTALTTLNLGHNKLTELPDSLGNLTTLTTLNLGNNELAQLPDSLGDLTALTELDLGDNQLTSLPGWLGNLTTLTELDLGDNQLTSLPGWLGNLTTLTTLDLRNNKLTQLPDSLGNLDNLTTLNLGHNKLTQLPDSLGNLDKITTLYLYYNQLTQLPDWLGKFTTLTTLNLGGNQLAQLPDWLGNLTTLTTLSLYRSQMEQIPLWFGNLTALTLLALGNNQLTHLPDWLGNLTSLTDLSLFNNQLEQLPDSLGNLGRLTKMDVSDNKLTQLPDSLGSLGNLRTLNLGNNQLEHLPDSLGSLRRLRALNLRNNQLTQLPDSLGNLDNLTTLNLGHNKLTQLPDSLGNLGKITTLFLGNNQLEQLPDNLGNLTTLTTLDLDNNQLTSLSAEVVSQGADAVLAYLRANRASIQQWTSKLLIVGEGRVGKTSLVKALSDHAHNPGEPTTHGLLLSRLPLPHPSEPSATMDLSVWDFGGQDIYHSTHQFFLTGRSLFLLAWNAGEGTDRGRLSYWLDIITARAPQARVLLVATHTAARPADIDLAGLREQYPAIIAHFSVDCATRTGIDALRTSIAAAAADLPLMGAAWPKRWVDATAELTAADLPPHLLTTEMWQVMNRTGVANAVERQTLATALHHRGEILYFPDDEDLADTVVLNPQWLNVHIASILDNPGVANRHGLLTADDMADAWPNLPRAEREHLLNLMDRFDVSYRIRDGHAGAKGIVVSWLPQAPPDISPAWPTDGNEIRLAYQLPVLPPGVPGWFLARSHRFATEYRWRTGALLRHPDGEHTGLLRTDTQRRRIELTVRGPMPAPFFAVLDDGLNLTLDRYPGLKVTRWVPCRGHGPCDEEFNYDKVFDRVRRGHHDIYCRELEGMVDIGALLTGITPPVRDLATAGDVRRLAATIEQMRDGMEQHSTLAQRNHLRVSTMIQQAQSAHCPSVFTIIPTGKRRIGKTVHTLRLYCEEPGTWHPLPGDAGCYEVDELAAWLRTAGPYMAKTLRVLRATVPYVGSILGVAAHDLQEQLSDEVDLFKQVLDDAPIDRLQDPDQTIHDRGSAPTRHADTDADYRVLRAMMLKLDEEQRWGGLSHLITPEGLSLYVCPEHLSPYRELPNR